MPLTGQAKTDYQREYMRRRRSNKIPSVEPESVRPYVRPARITVRPKEGFASDGFPIQHTNSMKVGYVPKG